MSLDEQYLLIMLGQVSNSPAIVTKTAAGGSIAKALERSPRLLSRVISSIEFDEEDGRMLTRPEIDRVRSVVRKIAIGLFVLRYQKTPAPSAVTFTDVVQRNVSADRPTPHFITAFLARFGKKQWRTVQAGSFSYIFVRDPKSSGKVWCVMDIHQTLWGVVHLPNPKSKKIREDANFWLA